MKNLTLQFVCETDGVIDQDFVSFLCNKCGGKMTKIGNTYVCEECLTPNAEFECRLCRKTNVKMKVIRK